MGLKIWLNNKLVDEADAKISVFDHGVLYGDGVFEGIRVYSGRIFELDAHIKRLYESAGVIRGEIAASAFGILAMTVLFFWYVQRAVAAWANYRFGFIVWRYF